MADVKLLRPQRLTDNPDGGGLATSIEIVDGQVNNLFDDISRIDRVNGELSLRKVFAQVTTPDTALYSDVHAIVQAPPADPRVSAVMFRTGSWSDERDDAKQQVERYLDESVITRMIPYDRQLQGQRTVLVFQRKELALPEIGEVYALKNETALKTEFIRVQDMDHQVETFTDPNGDYQVRVITLTISQPLSVEFSGSQPNRFFTVDAGKSVIRKTIASDAARYKGVVPLALNAIAGDLTIKVDSVFVQLVPAATTEIAVVDALPPGTVSMVAAGTAPQLVNVPAQNMSQVFSITPIFPGSVVVSTFSTYVDDKRGSLINPSAGNAIVGTVDYELGQVVGAPSLGSGNGTGLTWLPAAAVSKAPLSANVPVEIQNRGYVYVATLRPVPTPGSTAVSFRALGKWYTLQDDGSGALVGDIGVGSGLVNFQTGSVQVTLGALPDIGSSVLFAWGGSSEYEILDADVTIQVPAAEFTLALGSVEPGTFNATWLAGGITKTATANAAGDLLGDATGRIVYSTGEVLLRPLVLPNSNAVISVDYAYATMQQELFNPTKSAGTVTLSVAQAPVRTGSVSLDYVAVGPNVLGVGSNVTKRMRDNGSGQLVDVATGTLITGSSVNYTTGVINFNPDFETRMASLSRATYADGIPGRVIDPGTGYYSVKQPKNGRWPSAIQNSNVTAVFQNGAAMNVRYKRDIASDTNVVDEQVPIPALKVDLTPQVRNAIVPGGLLFVLGGRTYYDRQGVLYYGLDPQTGAGTAAGSVNYGSGVVNITSWAGNTAPAFDVRALLTEVAPLPLSVVHGRTPGSPLRPGTFYLQANRYRDGVLIAGLSDNNGNIDTTQMHGYVDVNTGVFSVAFGRYVLDSSLTAAEKLEDWYAAANVEADGYIWKPDEVIPGTIRFNCVVQTSLPQDPEIIKVNPVRLPMDGRVQAIRAGDTLVIHDTLPFTMPNPLAAGQVITLPRTGLASVALYDALGLGVAATKFTTNLPSGTITMATPLDLTGYVQPLVALHTVEDMALCLDAQITGEVSLGQALTRGYSAANSLVSAALVLGDAQARYASLFAQATWTNVWQDTLIGSAPGSGAQYNDAGYPVAVLNRDTITQRWALIFTSSTAFNIIGEELGVIGTGTVAAGAAPLNPATSQPYFTVPAAGFGSGWATGNVIRFNTVAAGGPIWVARTVRSGPATQQDDLIRLQLRWDKD